MSNKQLYIYGMLIHVTSEEQCCIYLDNRNTIDPWMINLFFVIIETCKPKRAGCELLKIETTCKILWLSLMQFKLLSARCTHVSEIKKIIYLLSIYDWNLTPIQKLLVSVESNWKMAVAWWRNEYSLYHQYNFIIVIVML